MLLKEGVQERLKQNMDLEIKQQKERNDSVKAQIQEIIARTGPNLDVLKGAKGEAMLALGMSLKQYVVQRQNNDGYQGQGQ